MKIRLTVEVKDLFRHAVAHRFGQEGTEPASRLFVENLLQTVVDNYVRGVTDQFLQKEGVDEE